MQSGEVIDVIIHLMAFFGLCRDICRNTSSLTLYRKYVQISLKLDQRLVLAY